MRPNDVALYTELLSDLGSACWNPRNRNTLADRNRMAREGLRRATSKVMGQDLRFPIEQAQLMEAELNPNMPKRHSQSRPDLWIALECLAQRYLTVRGMRAGVLPGRLLEFQEYRLASSEEPLVAYSLAKALLRSRPGGPFRLPAEALGWFTQAGSDSMETRRIVGDGLIDCHVHAGSVLSTHSAWLGFCGLTLEQARRFIWGISKDGTHNALGLSRPPATTLLRLLFVRPIRSLLAAIATCEELREADGGACSPLYPWLRDWVDRAATTLAEAFELELMASRLGDQWSRQHAAYLDLIAKVFVSDSDVWRAIRDVAAIDDDAAFERWLLVRCFVCTNESNIEPQISIDDLLAAYVYACNWYHRRATQQGIRSGFDYFSDYFGTGFRKPWAHKGINWRLLHEKSTLQGTHRTEIRVAETEKALAFPRSYRQTPSRAPHTAVGGPGGEGSPAGATIPPISEFGFVLHFKKEEDSGKKRFPLDMKEVPYLDFVRGRHWALRRKVEAEATMLSQARQRAQVGVERILAIDACSNERFARPEVFATAFRYLRGPVGSEVGPDILAAALKNRAEAPKLPRLMATYHAGESFNNPISGLRAIDEAIRFLELGPGDRIGHALALGVVPEAWEGSTSSCGLLEAEELFDNVVWMLSLKDKARIPANYSEAMSRWLRSEFPNLYAPLESFAGAADLTELLVRAWEIRWMSPERLRRAISALDRLDATPHKAWERLAIGREQGLQPASCFMRGCAFPGRCLSSHSPGSVCSNCQSGGTTPWLQCPALLRVFSAPERAWLRSSFDLSQILDSGVTKASLLCYWAYHFSREYCAQSKRSVRWSTNALPDWKLVFPYLRDYLLAEMGQRELAIETCPTSNWRIGGLSGYDQHLLFRITPPGKQDGPRPVRTLVCTDNPGIFCTTLPNEYLLLLETAKSLKYTMEEIEEWIAWLKANAEAATFLPRAK